MGLVPLGISDVPATLPDSYLTVARARKSLAHSWGIEAGGPIVDGGAKEREPNGGHVPPLLIPPFTRQRLSRIEPLTEGFLPK